MESTINPETTKMPLVETFLSLQGEGYHAGRLAFFVRFAGCNLNCVFAEGSVCDTPWQKPNMKWTLADLMAWMQETLPGVFHERGPRPMVIVTGGEPTAAPMFDDLVHKMKDLGFYVGVETNGTRLRTGLSVADWVVVSPKDRIHHQEPHQNPEVSFRVLAIAQEMRYVITGPDDEEPPYNKWATCHYLSPALHADGTGKEHQDPNYVPRFAAGAVERCLEIIRANPMWQLSIQTHKFLRVR